MHKNPNLNLNFLKKLTVQKNKVNDNTTFFDNNNIKKSPKIFNKKINNSSILIALNGIQKYVGKKQELISFSKEWKYSLYFYNKNTIKNLPSDMLNINRLIASYFRFYISHLASRDEYRSRKIIRRSLNKVHVSRSDVKHTNLKTIFTIYTYNRERMALLRNKQGKKILRLIKKLGNIINTKFYFLKKIIFNNKPQLTTILLQNLFKSQILLIRRYKLRLNYNQYKFEKKFLSRLAKFIKLFYNKEIEFNIVNLKSITFNTDIFTRLALLKSKKKYAKIYRIIFYILDIAKLPKINKIYERSRRKKNVDLNLVENKFLNFNLNSIVVTKKVNLVNDFTHIENKVSSVNKLAKIIFNCINYKNIGGIKLSIKGRLTKRYRADRAIHRLKWKGGLRNLDSSYKGLSVVRKRGFLNPSVEYSILASKRRIGAFAVKGWTSGK